MPSDQANGFSLIEIALVLLVVGILTAGLMKGYRFLKQARLQRTVAQLTSIRLAFASFKDRYQALPGDWAEAQGFFAETRSGNGDWILTGNPLTPFSETSLFWHHLVLTQMLKDVTFFKNRKVGADKGIFVPKTSMGCGLFALSDPDNLQGLWVLLARSTDPQKAYLSPQDAHTLDQQLDNGDPLSGRVQARTAPQAAAPCVINGRYNLSHKKSVCLVYVALD
ncbi:MAG: type II secretion system protein [Holosporaceae bacterium]